MKKIILIVLIFTVLIFVIVKNNNKPNNNENLEYTHSYYQGYYFDFNVVEKINNTQSIKNILSKINNLPESIITKLNSYNENYFQEKDLILIYFPMGSGTPTSTLNSLTVKDSIEVVINIKDYEVGTADMSGHLYIIEIEKSDKDLIVYNKSNENLNILQRTCEFNKTYKVEKVIDEESNYQRITLSSFTSDEKYEMSFGNTDYITFEEDKMYKFTFTPYAIPSIEDSIKNMMMGNFIKVKIEETEEIINEDICGVEKRYFIETDHSYTCDGENAIKLYKEMKDYNIYTYCTNNIYVINQNERISLKDYLNNNENFIDEMISKMTFEDVYGSGTIYVYRGDTTLFNNGLTIIKCSNSNIYITDWSVSFTKEPINFCDYE